MSQSSGPPDLSGSSAIVPVRFNVGGMALQCTTRQMSVEGCWVSCPVPPASGTRLSLRLYLPGEVTPEELTAIVRAAVASGDSKIRGFWAEFQPGAEPSQVRIARYLEQLAKEPRVTQPVLTPPPPRPSLTPSGGVARLTPSSGTSTVLGQIKGARLPASLLAPPSGAEKRTAPRVEIAQPIAVRFGSVEEFVLEYAANISAGGVFIRCLAPPPLQTKVHVRLELPDGGPPAEVDGLVLHRLTPSQVKDPRDAGMGVHFERPEPAFTSRVERFLDWAIAGGKG